MANETINEDLLIATEKTPHLATTQTPTDIIILPNGAQVPGVNWDDMKKMRKAGPCANTRNTFIDTAVIFVRDGRIDAVTKSTHPIPGLGKRSGFFRGDVSAFIGSYTLYKERRQVMRTTDLTRHNCVPPTGPNNCYGKVVINMAAVDLNAQLRNQIRKLCEIVSHTGVCAHGRQAPSGEQLEVVKSGAADEKMSFVVVRKDTTVNPAGAAKCQQVGEHAHWKAMYGSRLLKEQKGVDKFEVEVPGFAQPSVVGVIAGYKWMLDWLSGPQILSVTATSCASSRTAVIRCYPNGKLAVNFTPDIEKVKKLFSLINDAQWTLQYLGRMLNGGSVGKMKFDFIPDGCTLEFECEFKERTNHLVGAEWKLAFGLNPLCKLDFSWPIPVPVFLGPFGTVARIAQWIIEAAGFSGNFYVGFFFQVVAMGVIERSKDGVYSPGFDGAIEFTPNCRLELVKGPPQDPSAKLTCTLGVTFSLKLQIRPNRTGKGGSAKGVLSGEIQIGFTIEYMRAKKGTSKLVDYKPEWAKWPKTEGAWNMKEFTLF